ncbi:MAG: hypothetical protein GF390_00305 [Candidatus Pacebacteria bacterium]|nr:hypothetical protein [Candidatus Paceibacterota bacterium]
MKVFNPQISSANLTQVLSLSVTIISYILMLTFSWMQIQDYYHVNHWEYQRAGQAVDKLTPKTAKVIAPAFGDTQFLFQTKRTGWPIGFEITDKINKGATYYVTTANDDEAQELIKQYPIIAQTTEYLILQLNPEQANNH